MKHVLYIDTLSIGNFFENFGLGLKKMLAEVGVTLHSINAATSEDYGAELSALLNARSYEFALSFIGVGKGNVIGTESLWSIAKLPFITIYGDSPAYYFDQHRDFGDWTVSLYGFEDHLRFSQAFSILRGFHGMAPIMPTVTLDGGEIDWKMKEEGKLIFLKNGNDPRLLRELWQRALDPYVADALLQISSSMQASLDRCTHADIVEQCRDFLTGAGLYGGAERLLLLMVAQLDDYLRRVKSAMVADILLDYPAEVHGVNWGHIDAAGRRGTLVYEVDYLKSERLIRESLAIFDMSPNTVGGVHDRIARAAAHQTLCITNSGQGLERWFGDATFFTYNFSEESLRGRIEWLLAHRKDAVELGRTFSHEFSAKHSMQNAYNQLERMSHLVRQNNATAKPEGMQNYLFWPPESPVKTPGHRPLFHEDVGAWGGRLDVIEGCIRELQMKSATQAEQKPNLLSRLLR